MVFYIIKTLEDELTILKFNWTVFSLNRYISIHPSQHYSPLLFQLFVDKDTIINAVSSSHDIHLLKIDNREDDIVTRINQWLSTLMERIHQDKEVSRNRQRVSEINNLIDHLRDDLDVLEAQLAVY